MPKLLDNALCISTLITPTKLRIIARLTYIKHYYLIFFYKYYHYIGGG